MSGERVVNCRAMREKNTYPMDGSSLVNLFLRLHLEQVCTKGSPQNKEKTRIHRNLIGSATGRLTTWASAIAISSAVAITMSTTIPRLGTCDVR